MDIVAAALNDAAARDLRSILDALKRDGVKWIGEDGPEFVSRRRLIAATFALEAAHAGLMSQWEHSKAFIEWACDLLRRSGTPAQAERLWHLAAIAVIEGAMDQDALRAHIDHATVRVPDEPRWLLARAFVVEIDYWNARTTLNAAIAALERALPHPAIAGEAHLRIAYFELRRTNAQGALTHLRQAIEATEDRGVRHLARLFSAWAHERRRDHLSAVRDYRIALEEWPGALSATLGLASHLYGSNQRDEADALVGRALGGRHRDPWRSYGYGDLRRWPELIAPLREAVQ